MQKILEHIFHNAHDKGHLANSLSTLATSISGVMGIIFSFISKYISVFGTIGSVISWTLGVILMLVSIRYYWLNAKYKEEKLKQEEQKNHNQNQKTNE